MNNRDLKVILLSDSEFIKYILNEDIFIIVHQKSSLKSLVFKLTLNALKGKNNLVSLIESKLGDNIKNFEIKCLCPSVYKSEVDSYFLKLGINYIQKLYENSITAFAFANGTVRVEKRALVDSLKTSLKKDNIKVFIVDDSKTMRNVVKRMVSDMKGIEVVGECGDPTQAVDQILSFDPDVITLDITMPVMNGVQVLSTLLRKKFIPTIILTALNKEDSSEVIEALELGAIDYMQKPDFSKIAEHKSVFEEKLRMAALYEKKSIVCNGTKIEQGLESEDICIAIGSSTGGTEALRVLLGMLPNQIPPIVIVQHIPEYFSKALAERLDLHFSFSVREAVDGELLKANTVLIAPGGKQMRVVKQGRNAKISITAEGPVSGHRPSADVLFESVSKSFKEMALGAILTGMGKDGSKGLLSVKKAGGYTIGQDKESCVVYGMPKAAFEIGAVCKQLPLSEIGEELIVQAKKLSVSKAS